MTELEQGTVIELAPHPTQEEIQANTVASVLAARAKAEIEARYLIAMNRPRNMLQVRDVMLKECKRPGFARGEFKTAWFSKPQGNRKVEGFSISFAEMALKAMRNMDARSTVIFDGDLSRHILVEAVDLERNISIPTTIVVEKTVERRFLREGEVAISERHNSDGEVIYLRKATDDEIHQKTNNFVSKAMRENILRLIPGDLLAECRATILKIRKGEATQDPKQFQKAICDGFAKLNVTPDDLEELLGHPIARCSPEQLTHLRDIYQAIKDGETTFQDVLKAQGQTQAPQQPEGGE
jgi:hypothetical protein